MRHKHTFTAQSMVEFALIIPIILALILGFFDLGRAVFYNSSLSNAVREGTRSRIVMGFDENAIKAKVLEYAIGLPVTEDNIDIQVNLSKDNTGWETLQITATYCFEPITPGIISIVGNCNKTNGNRGFELSTKSVMRLE